MLPLLKVTGPYFPMPLAMCNAGSYLHWGCLGLDLTLKHVVFLSWHLFCHPFLTAARRCYLTAWPWDQTSLRMLPFERMFSWWQYALNYGYPSSSWASLEAPSLLPNPSCNLPCKAMHLTQSCWKVSSRQVKWVCLVKFIPSPYPPSLPFLLPPPPSVNSFPTSTPYPLSPPQPHSLTGPHVLLPV